MENDLLSSALRITLEHRWSLLGGVSLVWLLTYVVYMLFLHPLARYPGPSVASLTNLWKAYTMYQGRMEYVIHDLHEKHGAIVRIGPNDLVISHPDAVKQIYLAGSAFQKVLQVTILSKTRRNSIMASHRSDRMYSELKMRLSTVSDDGNYPIRSHKSQSCKWNPISMDVYLNW